MITDRLERYLSAFNGCTLEPIPRKVFKRTEPQPYTGRAKFTPRPGEPAQDLTGKMVVVVDEKLPPASPETVQGVRAATLAPIQIDRKEDHTTPYLAMGLVLAVIAAIVWVVMQ